MCNDAPALKSNVIKRNGHQRNISNSSQASTGAQSTGRERRSRKDRMCRGGVLNMSSIVCASLDSTFIESSPCFNRIKQHFDASACFS